MHQPVSDYIFTINKHYNGEEWMLVDINERTLACVWTTSQTKAYTFDSAEEATIAIDYLFNTEGHKGLRDCFVGEIFIGV